MELSYDSTQIENQVTLVGIGSRALVDSLKEENLAQHILTVEENNDYLNIVWRRKFLIDVETSSSGTNVAVKCRIILKCRFRRPSFLGAFSNRDVLVRAALMRARQKEMDVLSKEASFVQDFARSVAGKKWQCHLNGGARTNDYDANISADNSHLDHDHWSIGALRKTCPA